MHRLISTERTGLASLLMNGLGQRYVQYVNALTAERNALEGKRDERGFGHQVG